MSRHQLVPVTVGAAVLLLGGVACAGPPPALSSQPPPATGSAVPADLPAGTLVFRRFDADETRASLYTMASDGTDVRQITDAGPGIVDTLPDWSPDGRSVAFERQFADRPYEVHVVAADGSTERIVDPGCPEGIPQTQVCEEVEPDWSPDGTRIAFGWPYGQVVDDTIEVFAVGVMDPDGGAVEQLSNLVRPTSAEDTQPIWSPDGSRIAFVRLNISAEPVDATAMFVMNADGSGEQQITPWELRASDPAWSPDGSLISFRSEPDSGREFVGDLYTVASDGSALTQVTDHEDGTEVLGSTFSQNSAWIAFARTGVGGKPDIYVMRTDGTDLTPITSTPEWDSAPDWSPV